MLTGARPAKEAPAVRSTRPADWDVGFWSKRGLGDGGELKEGSGSQGGSQASWGFRCRLRHSFELWVIWCGGQAAVVVQRIRQRSSSVALAEHLEPPATV